MGRTILITGAGTGIGRDAAFALAARGHRVLATTFGEAQADELNRLAARSFHGDAADTGKQPSAQPGNAVARSGGSIEAFKLDICSAEDRERVRPLLIDVLVNNAGIGESGSLAEVDMERVRHNFEVNVFGTLALTQVVLAGMIERQRGTVLIVSSIAGRVPIPFLMPYSMTKFALSAAGAGLRAEMDELGRHVQVALIEPGAIHTGFNQAMTERKYEWMNERSYFAPLANRMRERERRQFRLLEARDTHAIVAQIVKACEARRPKLRYVAPWIQGLGVRLARMFGV